MAPPVVSQNPGYMKENFIIIIESLHLADAGMQHNVSHILCAVDSQSPCWFLAQKHPYAMICAIYTTFGTKLMPPVFFPLRNYNCSYNEMYIKKGKFLWGTGLTPKHLGLVYGPLCPLTIDSSLLYLQRRLAPNSARASISEGGN
jgi:hypothetical protein